MLNGKARCKEAGPQPGTALNPVRESWEIQLSDIFTLSSPNARFYAKAFFSQYSPLSSFFVSILGELICFEAPIGKVT